MNLKFPMQFDQNGKTAGSTDDNHIRNMIEQVLFTAPGERVNRPSFGSGLLQLVFEPNSNELAATTQFLVQSSLQQWLGDLIEVNDVKIESEEASLTVSVVYMVRSTQQVGLVTFTH
jgi:phage baseplate assembly protein W